MPRYRRWWPIAALLVPGLQAAYLLSAFRLYPGADSSTVLAYAGMLAYTATTVVTTIALVLSWGEKPWAMYAAGGGVGFTAAVNGAVIIGLSYDIGVSHSVIPTVAGVVAMVGLVVFGAATLRLYLLFPEPMSVDEIASALEHGGDPRTPPRKVRITSPALARRLAIRMHQPATAWIGGGVFALLLFVAIWFDSMLSVIPLMLTIWPAMLFCACCRASVTRHKGHPVLRVQKWVSGVSLASMVGGLILMTIDLPADWFHLDIDTAFFAAVGVTVLIVGLGLSAVALAFVRNGSAARHRRVVAATVAMLVVLGVVARQGLERVERATAVASAPAAPSPTSTPTARP